MGPNGNNTKDALDELQTYPILTQEVSLPSRSGSAAQGAPLGQTVETALRDVLGWRPKPGDPKGFVAALNQSFAAKDIDGRTELQWTPRSYAVQADMGAITGAQASIYARARAAVDQAIPLLDGLYPLRVDADPQDIESIRGIIRSELTELVAELGQPGGPRVQRVESILFLLINYPPAATDPQLPADPRNVIGHLGDLRRRFGLTSDRVNTVEEEQNITNYFILVDYISALTMSWDSQRDFFDRIGSDTFFGTQVYLLGHALEVIAESVQEVYFAMDSVFLGAAERQSAIINIDKQTPITVAELLDWADRVATVEGPRLIQDNGKDGVVALRETLTTVTNLVRAAAVEFAKGTAGSAALNTTRVVSAVSDLASQMEHAVDLTKKVHRELPEVQEPALGPVVLAATVGGTLPTGTQLGTGEVMLTIKGLHFSTDPLALPTVVLTRQGEKDIPGRLLGPVTATEIKAAFNVLAAPAGWWHVLVSQPEGSDGAPNVIEISPVLESINLPRGSNNITPAVDETPAAFALRVNPNTALTAIWEHQASTNTSKGWSPAAGAPNDLALITRGRPIFVVLSAPLTLSQPPL